MHAPDDDRNGDGHEHPGGPPSNGDHSPDRMHSSGSQMTGRDYDETPLIFTWEVTQACDLECDHCRAEAQPDRDPHELSTEEGKLLLEQIADFPDPGPILVLSGGDPLKRPDLFELIDHATDVDLPTAVTPAPTPDLDQATIRRFADAGVRRIALSLDGGTATAHDDFRGEDGSFETVMRAAGQAENAGLPIQINTTVTSNTVEELPQIADLVEEVGAVMWEVFFLVPVGHGEDLQQLDPIETIELMEWLYERQQQASFRVITVEAPHYRWVAKRIDKNAHVGTTRAGKGFTFVSHRGNMFPSGFFPKPVGNVRKDHAVDMYQNSHFFRRLRNADNFNGHCSSCPHRSLCGGSRSRAYAATDNPFASDPLCPRPTIVGDET